MDEQIATRILGNLQIRNILIEIVERGNGGPNMWDHLRLMPTPEQESMVC